MNPFFSRRLPALIVCSAVLISVLCGCDKATTPAAPLPKAGGEPVSLQNLSDPTRLAKVAEAALPKGDQNTPLNSFRRIESGNEIMFLYFGMLNLPIDYEKIASVYAREYNETSDSFKKKDILTALTPRIDQEIAKAKGARYVMLDNSGYDLISRYDFNKKSFAIPSLSDNNSYNYFYDNPQYSVARTNGASFADFSVPEEDRARVIEGYLSKNVKLKLEVYAFTQDADPANRRVKLEVMRVRLLSPTGEVLAQH